MTDDELVEKVAQEIDPHACWTPTPNWTIAPDIAKAWQDAARAKARAILSIARPIIEREALEKAAKRYDSLLGAFGELQGAAQKAVDETDHIHDNEPWPAKYRAPYAAITELRQVLAKQYGAR